MTEYVSDINLQTKFRLNFVSWSAYYLSVFEINLFRYGFPILETRLEVNSMRHSKQNFAMKTICLDYSSLEENRYQNSGHLIVRYRYKREGSWTFLERTEFAICVETELVINYLFLCKNEAVFELRQQYIPRYYHLNPNINNMGGMLSVCNVKLLNNIAVFVNKLNKLF